MASSSTRSPDQPQYSAYTNVWQPNQRTPTTQYVARKAQPIKRVDSEPLWRKDIQYDFLYYIFSDRTRAFVDYQAPDRPVVNFCDLYVNALYNSPKCSKVLKDKMVETPAFAIEFAKISLLTNVGRINTTMAFFPEMKTALRSYHPVPSLQKTDGNLQDAPRIKNCLKAALLPFEARGTPPTSPNAILENAAAGQLPTTSVVNLIFVLSSYSMLLGTTHFETPLDFMDLFLPHPLSSASRARAFLWLIFHYYQGPQAPNPFADEFSLKNPGKMPKIHRLTEEEMGMENVDMPEEIEWAKRKSNQRSVILRDLIETEELEKRAKGKLPTVPPGPKVGYAPPRNQRSPPPLPTLPPREDTTRPRENFRYYTPGDQTPLTPSDLSNGRSHLPQSSLHTSSTSHHQHHTPYPPVRSSLPAPSRRSSEKSTRGISLVDHAFQRALTTDPLADSDEEMDRPDDADSRRMDHIDRIYRAARRLYVITRLRGRSVTPETESSTPTTLPSIRPRANHNPIPFGPSSYTYRSQATSPTVLPPLRFSNVTPMDQETQTIRHGVSSLRTSSKSVNHTHRRGHSYDSGGLAHMDVDLSASTRSLSLKGHRHGDRDSEREREQDRERERDRGERDQQPSPPRSAHSRSSSTSVTPIQPKQVPPPVQPGGRLSQVQSWR